MAKKVTPTDVAKAMSSASTKQAVQLKGVKIVAVTRPDAIKEIADTKGINPQEVFVHVTFEHNGEQYQSSNQLRFFKQKGYEALLKSKSEGTAVDITLTMDMSKPDKDPLMYVDFKDETSVASLFAKKIERPASKTMNFFKVGA